VIEVDRQRNRLILSERSAAREAREVLKERLISELAIGEIRSGHVISLADFGAFVDIGGADGLVHISEISWKRVSNPREVLSVGQEVQVKVLGVDPDRNRISLSIRELEENPWEKILDQYDEGQLVEGTITKLTKFGAFAKLVGLEDYGIEGLVHISELSDRHITHPSEVVQEGQVLTLRVIRVDALRHRIGLSLKRVESSDYADRDWEAAVQEVEVDEELEPETEADFDAELEAEEALDMEAEDVPSEAETEDSEIEVDPDAPEPETDTEDPKAEIEPDAPEPETDAEDPEAVIEPDAPEPEIDTEQNEPDSELQEQPEMAEEAETGSEEPESTS